VTEPAPYQVVYSERVRQHLVKPAAEAGRRGDGEAFVAALNEFHRRLCIYRQFGDPLIDLTQEPGQVWVGIIRPLPMRYGLFEDRRLVPVTALPVLLPQAAP
jgi:hypothetical protein